MQFLGYNYKIYNYFWTDMKNSANLSLNPNLDCETAIFELYDIVQNNNISFSQKLNCIITSPWLTNEEKINWLKQIMVVVVAKLNKIYYKSSPSHY